MTQLHPIQKKLLNYIADNSIAEMSLREIGHAIDVKHPQQVAHHLERLERKGYIRRNEQTSGFSKLKSPIEDIVFLPMYGMAQCGPNDLFNEENHIEDVPLPTRIFNIHNSNDLFIVLAKGKSMEPKIHEKDLVVAKKQDYCNPGDTCLVVHNGHPKIKKVIKTLGGYVLMSFNQVFLPIEVTNEDDLRIVGVVRNVISNTI